MIGHRRLGEILVERGLLETALSEALAQQKLQPGLRLGVALVQLGVVSEDDVAEALAAQKGIPYVDPTRVQVDPSLVWKVSRHLAERRQIIPIGPSGDGKIVVAMADPEDREAIRELEFALNASVQPAVAAPGKLRRAIFRHYSMEPVAERMLSGVDPELRRLTRAPNYLDLDPGAIQSHLQGRGRQVYIDLVNFLLINAIERGASDVHLEPQAEEMRVRFRIDGMLREAVRIPSWAQDSIISRLKVLGKMDVAQRRRPQDGKVSASFGDRRVELRIATMPSQFGESVVVRILDPRMVRQDLAELGWRREALQTYYRILGNPRGLVLVCGPTGSGKSTTLYATIHRLNREQTSIVTIEDPVEYSLAGITQVQVDEAAGVSFASSIRALMRQDPNVLVIGEIRDAQTAAAATDAATTGHLVLSTLHTSSVVGAITRLRDLGVPNYMLGAAISGLVAQRLVRRVCPECSVPAEPTPEDWLRLGLKAVELGPKARRVGPGCPYCQYMGYAGRIGIFEILPFSQKISALVQEGAGEAALWDWVQHESLVTLFEDALRRVQQGHTTMEEIGRLVPVADYPRPVIEAALRRSQAERSAAAELESAGDLGPAPVPVDVIDLEPLHTEDLPAEPDSIPEPAEQAAAEPAEEVVARPAAKTGRPTVLVVDDAEEIVQLVTMTLEDDYDIRVARDGIEAMNAVAEAHPDLIVLDVMMPRMSGYEVCQSLKEFEDTADIPVLFLSARGETAHIKKGFYAGADDYLPKPFDPEEMMLRVRALLRRSGWKL